MKQKLRKTAVSLLVAASMVVSPLATAFGGANVVYGDQGDQTTGTGESKEHGNAWLQIGNGNLFLYLAQEMVGDKSAFGAVFDTEEAAKAATTNNIGSIDGKKTSVGSYYRYELGAHSKGYVVYVLGTEKSEPISIESAEKAPFTSDVSGCKIVDGKIVLYRELNEGATVYYTICDTEEAALKTDANSLPGNNVQSVDGEVSFTIEGQNLDDVKDKYLVYSFNKGDTGLKYAKISDIPVENGAKYTVEHYLERTDGTYVKQDDATETKTGEKESTVTATPKSFNGYQYDATRTEEASGTVAEDDSLVLKLYYKRGTYSITYVTNSGAFEAGTEEPKTYVYGTGVVTLPTPKREHFTFEGWYDNEELTGAAVTVVSAEKFGDITLYAKWVSDGTATEYSYKIEHYKQKADKSGYEEPETETAKVFEGEEAKATPKEYEGYKYAADKDETSGKLEDGNLVLKLYYDVDEVVETPVDESDLYEGRGVEYKDGKLRFWVADAQGTPNSIKFQYKICASETEAQNIKKDKDVSKDPAAMDGKEMQGPDKSRKYWYGEIETVLTDNQYLAYGFYMFGGPENGLGTISVISQADAVAAANKARYTIEYYVQEKYNVGEAEGVYPSKPAEGDSKSVVGIVGETIELTDKELARDGFTLDTQESGYKAKGEVSATETLVLKIYYKRRVYNIDYVLNDGKLPEGKSNPDKYVYGVGVKEFASPVKENCAFDGWYSDAEFKNKVESVSDSKRDENGLTLYAKWRTEAEYTVNHYYQSLDGTYPETPKTIKAVGAIGSPVDMDEAQEQETGFTYIGTKDGQAVTATVSADNSTVIDLYYTRNSYKITYMDGTEKIKEAEYKFGSALELPKQEKANCVFDGWYKTAAFDADSKIDKITETTSGDLTLYAKWRTTSQYKVEYYQQTTDRKDYKLFETDSAEAEIGKEVEAEDKEYTGFLRNDEAEGSKPDGTIPAENNSLVLKVYYDREEYDVTYELDGGTNAADNPNTFVYGVGIAKLKAPTKDGYRFDGWFTDLANGQAVDFVSETAAEDMTFYAKWTLVEVDVQSVELDKKSLTLKVNETQKLTATVKPGNATDSGVTWDSSNESIATVDENGNVKGIKAGKTQITATAHNGVVGQCQVEVICPVTGIEAVGETEINLNKGGEGILLDYKIAPENATNKAVTWKSSNENAVTVQNGTIMAVSAGEATITVTTADGGFSAEWQVTVRGETTVTGVSLDQTEMTLVVDGTEKLTATAELGDEQDLQMIWESDDPEIAEVDQTGQVTAKKAGTTTIWVRVGTDSASCEVTVILPIESLALDTNILEMTVGDSGKLSLTKTPVNATESVKWASSDPDVVEVDENGNLTAKKAGEATITVSAEINHKVVPCKVTVKELVYTVEFDSNGGSAIEAQTVSKGDNAVMPTAPTKAGYLFVGWFVESNQYRFETPVIGDLTLKAMWMVDPQAGVTPPVVDNTVKVSNMAIAGISNKIAMGKTIQLVVAVEPLNAANKNVTWHSSDETLATVDANGVVRTYKTTKKNPTVTITARAADGSGKEANYTIKLMKTAVKKIKLKASKTKVKAGKSVKIKATLSPSASASKMNKTLIWTSNSKYATVNSKGVVKTKKAGKGKTVTITAMSTDGSNKKKKIKIKLI